MAPHLVHQFAQSQIFTGPGSMIVVIVVIMVMIVAVIMMTMAMMIMSVTVVRDAGSGINRFARHLHHKSPVTSDIS
jgi:flagellar basal body-associated protein FliL